MKGVGGGAADGGLQGLLKEKAAVGRVVTRAASEEFGGKCRCEDGVDVVDGGGAHASSVLGAASGCEGRGHHPPPHPRRRHDPADFLTKWLSGPKLKASLAFVTNAKNRVSP